MKFAGVIIKNFKVLMRAKASAFTVLVGPLLIIALIGLAFSGKASYDFHLGYYAPSPNNMTESYVASLQMSNYLVQEFSSEHECVKKIEQGIINTCIIFPEDFRLDNSQSNELRFLVDYSRMNLVYQIIESVSSKLDLESKELSYSLTQVLLSRINSTIQALEADIKAIDGLSSRFSAMQADLQKARDNTESMEFDPGEVSLDDLRLSLASLNTTLQSMIDEGWEIMNLSKEWIDDLSSYENVSDIEEDYAVLRDSLSELYTSAPEKLEQISTNTVVLSSSLSKAQESLAKNRQLNQELQQRIDSLRESLASSQSSLDDLRKSLDSTKKDLEGIQITSAETIVNPVNTLIEPVVPENSKLTFTFPFLLMLVIMFVALLLSSTLVIFEKSSKAYFRNHITPTRQEFFVITTFITSTIVIVVQTFIILALANYFLKIPLMKNAAGTLLLIFLASSFFIVLGMAIGYLFSTQEGAIMASIIIGSVFLFLSNLVVPLESLAPRLAGIVKYNPYVLASEFLRKSLLFTISLLEEFMVLLILGGAAIVIFVVILFSVGLKNRKRAKAWKGNKLLLTKKNNLGLDETASDAFQPGSSRKPVLMLGEKQVSTKEELFKLLSDMTRAEFEDYVSSHQNRIADWAERRLGDKKLASKLRKASSRNEMMKIVQEELPKGDDEQKGEQEHGSAR